MLFNKKLLILFCLIFNQSVFSQKDNFKQAFYYRYQAVGNYKFSDWNVDDKNTYGFNFKSKDYDFKKRFTYDIGYRFTYNSKYYTSLSYQHYTGRILQLSSSSNVGAQIDLAVNSISWGFGIHLGNSEKRFSVSPFLNMVIGAPIRFTYETIGVDGFHSRGSEKSSNGTYAASGPSLGEELGLLFKFNVSESFSIECEAANMWSNLVAPGTVDDPSLYKTFTGSISATSSGFTDKISATKLMIGLSYSFSNKMNGTWYL